jgi:hypothetical protein
MTRLLSLNLVAVLFLAAAGAPTDSPLSARTSQVIPRAATVKIILLKAPGLNDEGSRWEIAYEFRIINQADEWQAWKQGKFKAGSRERVGELIKEGGGKATLRSPKNREVIFYIPFSPDIQKRLRNQPRDRVKIASGEMAPEDIKLLKEQEMKSQVFLFYPIINIYDAKLKKNFIISYPQTWGFDDNPQARFEIKVEINNDGSYKVNTSLPAKALGSN